MPPPATDRSTDAPGVLLVVPWDQVQGGVNTVVRNLARALRERGREPLFLFPGKAVAPIPGVSKLGFPAVAMNLRRFVSARRPVVSALGFVLTAPVSLLHLRRLVRSRAIAVVNVHYPEPNAALFVALRRIAGVRLVTSVHGSDLTGLPTRRYERWQIEFVLRHSDAIVAPSVAYGDYVRREFPAVADRVLSVPGSVDVEGVVRMAASDGPPPTAANGEPYFVCVAAFNAKKAHDTLVRAFARVPRPFRLLLAGDGPLRSQTERLVAELGISDRVLFLGEQHSVAVAKLLAGAVGSVLASRDEPFGIAAVESMAVGTPVVATSVGGLAENVLHEQTGLVVPVDDVEALALAIVRLARDPVLRDRLGRTARDRARARFDWRAWADSYLSVLTGVRPTPAAARASTPA